MVLTFKVKHGHDFSEEFRKAALVADFAVKTGASSSKDVKQFGLPSAISNQLLRKYGRGKIKRVRRLVLPVPGQAVKLLGDTLRIPCLKFQLEFHPHREIIKVNQVEIGREFAYVACAVAEKPESGSGWLGVDLNTTGHCAVVANIDTGKILKLGKCAGHIRRKARAIRRTLQRKGKLRRLKAHANKEQRRIRNLDHRISKRIVMEAVASGKGIRVENLEGIRGRAKTAKSFRASLHSWSFYQLQTFLEYKAKLHGVPFQKIDPAFTSQGDSRTGLLGTRSGKVFRSPSGRVEHADVNAAFNIALASLDVARLRAERDARKGSLKPLKAQRVKKPRDARTPRL